MSTPPRAQPEGGNPADGNPANDAREIFPMARFNNRKFFHPATGAATSSDFRPRTVPADAPDPVDEHMDCKFPCGPACWAPARKPEVEKDPKVVGSSVTDSASHSETDDTESGNSGSPSKDQTKTDPSPTSESSGSPVAAAKVEALIPPSTLPPTVQSSSGSPKEPVEASGSAAKPIPKTGMSSSLVEAKLPTPQS